MCPHDAIIQERAAAIQKYLRDSKRSAHAPMSWRRRTGIHQACERKVFLGQSAPQAQAFFEPIALDNKAPAHRPFLGSAQVVLLVRKRNTHGGDASSADLVFGVLSNAEHTCVTVAVNSPR